MTFSFAIYYRSNSWNWTNFYFYWWSL